MSEVPQTIPKVIVVAEDEVHELLRASGAHWDVQHRVGSISQMWDDLGSGRLDGHSVSIVFSDKTFAQPGELEDAIAAMAPHAATFLLAWDVEHVDGLLSRVTASAAAQQVPAAPVYVLSPASRTLLLDTVRMVLTDTGVPVSFPEQWSVTDGGPLSAVPAAAPVFVPEPHTAAPVAPVPPAPAPVPPAAPAPVASTPAYVPPPAPAPVTTQPYEPAPYRSASDQNDPLDKPILPGQVTLAVTSSKGGSGKSTTAMMVAAQIAHSSQKAFEQGLIERPLKVCLVDMDTRDGQVASLIGSYVPTALNIRVAPTWDEKTITDNLVYDHKLGIYALLAPVRPRTADDVGPDFYRHVIRTLKTTHDVVIMDTSVNYLDPLISTVCLPEATAILFVTTLATTSVQGMARALREITEPVDRGGMGIKLQKIGIVVNQSITEVGMDREQVLQAALKVAIVGAIPLATKDVLTATNYNRMHQLLKHPLLGPAYYKLAKTCMKNVPLVPLMNDPKDPNAAHAALTTATPVNGTPVANGSEQAEDSGKKRGLFGRRG